MATMIIDNHWHHSQNNNTTSTTTEVNNSNQNSPNRYEDAQRIRLRMQLLRKHHNESADIHNRTQPIINQKIHHETLKYLKASQTSKAKNHKPRSQRRPRNQSNVACEPRGQLTLESRNNQAKVSSSCDEVSSTVEGSSVEEQSVQNSQMIHNQQYYYEYHSCPQQMQAATSAASNELYQKQFTYPNYNHPENSAYIDQSYTQRHQSYVGHQILGDTNHNSVNRTITTEYQAGGYIGNSQYPSANFIPNDLDVRLEPRLECDVDSVIKHEMQVEGQLGFNSELLHKLDDQHPYRQVKHQHQLQHPPNGLYNTQHFYPH